MSPPPLVSAEAAATLAREHWGIECSAVQRLPGYDDTNWRIDSPNGAVHVLKCLNAADSCGRIAEAQNSVVAHLRAAGFAVPIALPLTSSATQDGSDGCTLRVDGTAPCRRHAVRLLSWLPGTLLVDVAQSPVLYGSLGALLARINRTLLGSGLEQRFPELRRDFDWNLMCLPSTYARVRPGLTTLTGVDVALLDEVVADFQRTTLVADHHLRRGIIHNDANERNCLVDAELAAAAARGANNLSAELHISLIDWGDTCFQWLVAEAATALSYIMLLNSNVDDPLPAARAFLAKFELELPLLRVERSMLRVLTMGRLALSLSMGLHSAALAPANAAYLLGTQQNGWRLLRMLAGMSDDAVFP